MTTTDGHRRRQVAEALADLGVIARHFAAVTDGGTGNLQRLHDMQAGLRAANYDADTGGVRSGPGHGDPTGEAAVTNIDVPGRDLHRGDMLLARISRDVAELRRLYSAYGPPRAAGEAERAALARKNDRGEPGCDSCARTEVAKGVPRWVAPDPKWKAPTDMDGRLAKPMWLCRWCYDRVGLWGRLPSVAELELLHEKGPRAVGWPKDVPHPDRRRSA